MRTPPSTPAARLHGPTDVAAGVARLADALAALAPADAGVGVVGIRTRGLTLARRLHDLLAPRLPRLAPLGALDITLYRDDLSTLGPQPLVRPTDLPFAVDGATILLVDDVLFTGRTIRAALDALLAFGRPAAVRLAVLVDRGHRELPIQPDVAAWSLATRRDDVVAVRLAEDDGLDAIDLLTPRA